jgi:hypothetical protein
MAAFFRFMTTGLEMEASICKETISKQNYAEDECFLSTLYDFHHDNLLKADGK